MFLIIFSHFRNLQHWSSPDLFILKDLPFRSSLNSPGYRCDIAALAQKNLRPQEKFLDLFLPSRHERKNMNI